MPVKLLHTSDLHLGHELHDVDRAPEQRKLLEWLIECCEREQVQALLIAGDIFDVSNPPASALALWAEFLVRLWSRMKDIKVVVIGGNHDSAHRLEMNQPFHAALGRLTVLGAIPRAQGSVDLDRALIQVDGSGGDSALIAAVPFLRPADLKASEVGGDPAAPVRRVLDEVFSAARARRRPGEALVAMGHLFVTGSAPSVSERMLVGGIGAVPVDVYPPDVAYAALGHLHRPQAFGPTVRYAGAPLPLAFDDAGVQQEVVLVTLVGERLAEARSIPVPRFCELIRIPSDGFGKLGDVLGALTALPPGDASSDDSPLVEARVLLERPEPTLRQQLDGAIAGKRGRLVRVQVQYALEGAPLAEAVSTQTLRDLDPILVFKKRWARDYPGDPPADLLEAYADVLEEARAEEGES